MVMGGVVVAEHEVLQERAVGVLDAEVAFVDHEIDVVWSDEMTTGWARASSDRAHAGRRVVSLDLPLDVVRWHPTTRARVSDGASGLGTSPANETVTRSTRIRTRRSRVGERQVALVLL